MDSLSILKLTELLRNPDEEEDEEISTEKPSMTPGSIGNPRQDVGSKISSEGHTHFNSYGSQSFLCPIGKDNGERKVEADQKDIWDEDEVPGVEDSSTLDDVDDGRQIPEYECLFRQKVGANEVFLGLGGKDPSTASCEELLIKIKLPDTKQKDIDLDVKPTVLCCRSPKYKLHLPLVHRVDEKKGSAKWDSEREILSVILPMIREYDFMKA